MFKKIYQKCIVNRKGRITTIIIAASVLAVAVVAATTAILISHLNKPKAESNNSLYVNADKNEQTDSGPEKDRNREQKDETDTDGTNSKGSEDISSGNISQTEYVSTPQTEYATMTEKDILSQYRGNTDWRINSIRGTETKVKPTGNGIAYYISAKGSDKNDGLTPETPKKTINAVNSLPLKSGDVVYFRRGDVWRGQVKASTNGVTYSAYGNGKKPEIYASTRDGAKSGKWTETSTKGIYKYSFIFSSDVGTIVFDDSKCAIKCILRHEPDGDYNNTTGEKFNSYADLNKDLHFYHDPSGALYLRCNKGNPATVFKSIEFSIKNHVFAIGADNVTIDNICIKYCGSHGVGAGTRTGLTVTNCEFKWIGGSIQAEGIYGRNFATRYGNGVEIYGGCDNFTVKNCYFSQIYDAAVTFQFSTNDGRKITMNNVDFSDNVMEYCNYSVEYFLTASNDSLIKNVTIKNNSMWYAGFGLCEQRPDKSCDSHIKAWDHSNRTDGTFRITDNIFAFARNDLLQSNAKDGEYGPTYSNNIYIQYKYGNLGSNGRTKTVYSFDDNVKYILNQRFGDTSPKIIFAEG